MVGLSKSESQKDHWICAGFFVLGGGMLPLRASATTKMIAEKKGILCEADGEFTVKVNRGKNQKLKI